MVCHTGSHAHQHPLCNVTTYSTACRVSGRSTRSRTMYAMYASQWRSDQTLYVDSASAPSAGKLSSALPRKAYTCRLRATAAGGGHSCITFVRNRENQRKLEGHEGTVAHAYPPAGMTTSVFHPVAHADPPVGIHTGWLAAAHAAHAPQLQPWQLGKTRMRGMPRCMHSTTAAGPCQCRAGRAIQ